MNKPSFWDEEKTISRLGGDRSLIEKLIALFLRDAPKQISQAQKGIEQHNYDDSHVAVHSLKGTSSCFCTAQFEDLCADLLMALKKQDWKEAEVIHAQLHHAYLQLEIEFELFLEQ